MLSYQVVRSFVCLSVHLCVCYQICEHNILKTNELIVMSNWHKSSTGQERMTRSDQRWGSGGQSSKSQEVNDIFEGIIRDLLGSSRFPSLSEF